MNLKEELELRGISQRELAELVGVSPAAISMIVSGQSPGRPATLRAIRAALGGYALRESRPAAPSPAPAEPGSLTVHRNPNKRRS